MYLSNIQCHKHPWLSWMQIHVFHAIRSSGKLALDIQTKRLQSVVTQCECEARTTFPAKIDNTYHAVVRSEESSTTNREDVSHAKRIGYPSTYDTTHSKRQTNAGKKKMLLHADWWIPSSQERKTQSPFPTISNRRWKSGPQGLLVGCLRVNFI